MTSPGTVPGLVPCLPAYHRTRSLLRSRSSGIEPPRYVIRGLLLSERWPASVASRRSVSPALQSRAPGVGSSQVTGTRHGDYGEGQQDKIDGPDETQAFLIRVQPGYERV